MLPLPGNVNIDIAIIKEDDNTSSFLIFNAELYFTYLFSTNPVKIVA